MATTLQRHRLRGEFAERLRTAYGPDVTVEEYFPGRLTTYENVWCNGIQGAQEHPFAMSGRQSRYDDFTMRWMFSAGLAGQTIADASARAAELFEALEDLVADDADGSGWSGEVHDLRLGEVDGPNVFMTDMGPVAIVEAEVIVRSFLT